VGFVDLQGSQPTRRSVAEELSVALAENAKKFVVIDPNPLAKPS